MVDTLKEAEDRIREAMKPLRTTNGNGFSPAIQGMRQQRRLLPPVRRQLPTAR